MNVWTKLEVNTPHHKPSNPNPHGEDDRDDALYRGYRGTVIDAVACYMRQMDEKLLGIEDTVAARRAHARQEREKERQEREKEEARQRMQAEADARAMMLIIGSRMRPSWGTTTFSAAMPMAAMGGRSRRSPPTLLPTATASDFRRLFFSQSSGSLQVASLGGRQDADHGEEQVEMASDIHPF